MREMVYDMNFKELIPFIIFLYISIMLKVRVRAFDACAMSTRINIW